MRDCPHCGAELNQEVAYCPACGSAIGDTDPRHAEKIASGHRPQDGPASGGRSGEQRSSGTRQQGQGRSPKQAGQSGRTGGQGHSPPPQRGQRAPPSGERSGSGFSRRRLLTAGGGVALLAAAGGAGWFFFLRDTAASPKAVVERSWRVWENGDFETYNRMVHPQSPMRTEEWWQESQTNFGPQEGLEWSIKSRELISQSDTRAVVKEVYVWNPPNRDSVRITDHVVLRKNDGAWKIWERRSQTDQ